MVATAGPSPTENRATKSSPMNDQSNKQTIKQSVGRSVGRSVSQSLSQSVNQSIVNLYNDTIVHQQLTSQRHQKYGTWSAKR